MLLPLGSGLTARTFCFLGFALVIHAIGLSSFSSFCAVCGWPVSWLLRRILMRVRELFFVFSSPLCYLLRRCAIRFMFWAKTARFFANPPLRFPAAIFFAVAFPNLPIVPLRFMRLVAF
jgi:hypothetical protein